MCLTRITNLRSLDVSVDLSRKSFFRTFLRTACADVRLGVDL